jgi:hypothetical protein
METPFYPLSLSFLPECALEKDCYSSKYVQELQRLTPIPHSLNTLFNATILFLEEASIPYILARGVYSKGMLFSYSAFETNRIHLLILEHYRELLRSLLPKYFHKQNIRWSYHSAHVYRLNLMEGPFSALDGVYLHLYKENNDGSRTILNPKYL